MRTGPECLVSKWPLRQQTSSEVRSACHMHVCSGPGDNQCHCEHARQLYAWTASVQAAPTSLSNTQSPARSMLGYSRQNVALRSRVGVSHRLKVSQHIPRRQGPAVSWTCWGFCKQGSPPEVPLLTCSTPPACKLCTGPADSGSRPAAKGNSACRQQRRAHLFSQRPWLFQRDISSRSLPIMSCCPCAVSRQAIMVTETGKSSQFLGLTASGSGHTLGGCRPRCSKHSPGQRLVAQVAAAAVVSFAQAGLEETDTGLPNCGLHSSLQQASMRSHWSGGLHLKQAAAGIFLFSLG